MKIDVLTLFPEMLRPMLSASILGRAVENGILQVNLVNIRDYTLDKHRRTDDYPFGGGAGMVMFPQPIMDAVAACDPEHRARRIYLSPRGRTLNQKIVEELAGEEQLLFLCGHYEGVDQRALDVCIDEELSIGDYVLTGGELGALVTIDAVSRLVPGVLGSDESSLDESFSTGLLEYPQYTRPADYLGMRVPGVLQGGNHADIVAWRREQSLEITLDRRPEMLETAPLTENDRRLLARLRRSKKLIALLGEIAVRMDFSEADAFAKRWFAVFVPEENRKAAKKQCFSGRRHVGYLWQAFTMGFAPAEKVDKLPEMTGAGFLFVPDDAVLIQITALEKLNPDALQQIPSYILVNQTLSETYVQTGKANIGAFYSKI